MGSRIGVVGRNGAGKSTREPQLPVVEMSGLSAVDFRLLNLLAGELLPPDDETGEVAWT